MAYYDIMNNAMQTINTIKQTITHRCVMEIEIQDGDSRWRFKMEMEMVMNDVMTNGHSEDTMLYNEEWEHC
jgi:hypothetical protein